MPPLNDKTPEAALPVLRSLKNLVGVKILPYTISPPQSTPRSEWIIPSSVPTPTEAQVAAARKLTADSGINVMKNKKPFFEKIGKKVRKSERKTELPP
ncbi:MAG: hypothetical protein ACLUSP_11135 [Christensenellales bacterium]